jgi:TNF receptor-associated factor 4
MIQDHLKFTCIKRRVNCKFCFKEFLGEEMENHAGSCDLEPIYCESKCGNKILRGNLSLHKSKICLKRLVPCNFCSKEFVIETITLHQKNCHLRHTSSKIQNSVLKAHDENIMVACLFADAGCKFKGIKSLLETHLESSTSLHLSMMVHYAEKQKKEIDMLKTTVKKLNVNYSGTLLWKITNWESRLDEAKRNENIELVSPNFYSSNYGYNLQVSVFPNGNGKGENTHMSVFIKILPGEFDALLKWPFDQKITFTLFEQSSEHDNVQGGIAESFTTSDLNWKNFKSPSEDADELGFGFPFFVSHDALKTRPFIRNNTVFLRIKCEPNKSFSV